MAYPRLVVNKQKLIDNATHMTKICRAHAIDVMAVTKSFCADRQIAECLVAGGVSYLADSRLTNLINLQAINLPKVLLRLPALSEIDQVVKYVDLSLNSEMKTMQALNRAAKKIDTVHSVLLMLDLGDLREGILVQDFDNYIEEIKALDHLQLYGLGVNLTCYGGVIPGQENLGALVHYAQRLKTKHGIAARMVSGGNSSSVYLVEKSQLPAAITNLRLGEVLVLGRETAYGQAIPGLHQDAFRLEAEIIEKKEKPSLPSGEIGRDAFGNVPTFVDKGKRIRAILAVGRQDVSPDHLHPVHAGIEILGASSDHLIVDITDVAAQYDVGDIVQFHLEYGALLSLTTSSYVDISYIEDES